MQNLKRAFAGNIVIFILEVFAVWWIISGISNSTGPLDGPDIESLKYYTVDSNILMGVAALAAAVAQRRVIRGQTAEVPEAVQILKLSGTGSVTLTMLITIFFLGPTLGRTYGFFSLFANSTLFLHLINPVAAILLFAWLEKPGVIPKGKILWAVVPTIVYGIYYVAVALSHVEGGRIAEGYDWYGFFAFGINVWWIVVLIILLITFGIMLALWRLNRGKPEKLPDAE